MSGLYDLTVILNGNDISTQYDYDSLSHDDNLRSPSYFSLIVQNPSFVPEQGMQLLVIAKSMPGTPVIFNGYVLELVIRKRDNGISLEYELDCGDVKALMAKAIVPYQEHSGTDADIISGIFNSSYPDLSDIIDFTSGVDSFGDDLSFTTNEESLLDALSRFADSTGGNFRFDTFTGEGDIVLSFTPDTDVLEQETFQTGGATPYWTFNPINDYTESVAGGEGHPGHCFKAVCGGYTAPGGETIVFTVHMGALMDIENVSFDLKVSGGNGPTSKNASVQVIGQSDLMLSPTSIGPGHDYEFEQWIHFDCAALEPSNFPASTGTNGTENPVEIRLSYSSLSNGGSPTFFLDNVRITASAATQEGGKDKLVYSAVPESTDFDFDIQNGTEFGSNFDLNLGAIDDFNSITVVGGKELVAVDEALEWDGSSSYMKLPFAVRSLAVYKNTGSDVSPSWTTQTLGIDGTDVVGSKDVLHNTSEQFLYFDTEPANMRKSVRITGFREKPIRVQVENIGEGSLTFATIVTNENITSEEEAIAYANSLLAKKNAPRRMEFETHNEGLKVGQEIAIVDSARGMSESLLIRRISTKWIGSNSALFKVEAGDDEASGIDNIIIGIDKKANKALASGAIITNSIQKLLDEDGSDLVDALGSVLYESS